MEKFSWKSDYNVGIELIDHQHKNLADMINLIGMAVSHGQEKEAIDRVLGSLVAHARHHFEEEERLMVSGKDREQDHHRDFHNGQIERLSAVRRQYREGEDLDGLDVFLFLRDWLVEHIMSGGQKIGPASESEAGTIN